MPQTTLINLLFRVRSTVNHRLGCGISTLLSSSELLRDDIKGVTKVDTRRLTRRGGGNYQGIRKADMRRLTRR